MTCTRTEDGIHVFGFITVKNKRFMECVYCFYVREVGSV